VTTLSCPDLQCAFDAVEDVLRGVAPESFSRVVTGSWTLAHVLEHLGKAYGGTAAYMEAAVDAGIPKGTAPGIVQRVMTAVIVGGWYFPTGVKSPAVATPAGVDGALAQRLAREGLVRLDVACERALTAFGPAVRVANHPMLGGFTVKQWRGFHRWHTEHHLRQIRAARL